MSQTPHLVKPFLISVAVAGRNEGRRTSWSELVLIQQFGAILDFVVIAKGFE